MNRSAIITIACIGAASFSGGLATMARATDVSAGYTAPIPSSAGNGLNGLYYGQPGSESQGTDDAYAAANSPVATFTSTHVDYPIGVNSSSYGDGNTLSAFLGGDASTLSNSAVTNSGLDNQLIRFSGYIALQAGTTNFQYGVDDGGYVNIGGVQVISNDGTHAFNNVSGSADVTQAGLYPILIDYHELGGNTGVSFHLLDSKGGDLGVVPTNILYTSVPEPASLALVGLGSVGLLARRRRA